MDTEKRKRYEAIASEIVREPLCAAAAAEIIESDTLKNL